MQGAPRSSRAGMKQIKRLRGSRRSNCQAACQMRRYRSFGVTAGHLCNRQSSVETRTCGCRTLSLCSVRLGLTDEPRLNEPQRGHRCLYNGSVLDASHQRRRQALFAISKLIFGDISIAKHLRQTTDAAKWNNALVSMLMREASLLHTSCGSCHEACITTRFGSSAHAERSLPGRWLGRYPPTGL